MSSLTVSYPSVGRRDVHVTAMAGPFRLPAAVNAFPSVRPRLHRQGNRLVQHRTLGALGLLARTPIFASVLFCDFPARIHRQCFSHLPSPPQHLHDGQRFRGHSRNGARTPFREHNRVSSAPWKLLRFRFGLQDSPSISPRQ